MLCISQRFVNLIKVSSWFKHAGDCLIELASSMPGDQINGACIDLFNGLELATTGF